MGTLLHISSSPRGGASETLSIAETFLDTYRKTNPDDRIETFDLWDGTLPEFGSDAAAAKMSRFGGAAGSGVVDDAWHAVLRTFERFDSADKYLFGVPMWNSGIPYILKQFVDVVSQSGLLFTFDKKLGYSGLLTGKRAAVIYTSAVYRDGRPPSFGFDHQRPYFTGWLRWAGIPYVAEIDFRPNQAVPDVHAAREAAHHRAREEAREF